MPAEIVPGRETSHRLRGGLLKQLKLSNNEHEARIYLKTVLLLRNARSMKEDKRKCRMQSAECKM